MILWLLEVVSGLPSERLTSIAYTVTCFGLLGIGVAVVASGVFIAVGIAERREARGEGKRE